MTGFGAGVGAGPGTKSHLSAKMLPWCLDVELEDAVVGLNKAAPVLEDIGPTSAFYKSLGFLGF